MGSPIVLFFCINIKDLEEQWALFPSKTSKEILSEELLFFAIKNYCLPVGESVVGHSNVMLWIGGR